MLFSACPWHFAFFFNIFNQCLTIQSAYCFYFCLHSLFFPILYSLFRIPIFHLCFAFATVLHIVSPSVFLPLTRRFLVIILHLILWSTNSLLSLRLYQLFNLLSVFPPVVQLISSFIFIPVLPCCCPSVLDRYVPDALFIPILFIAIIFYPPPLLLYCYSHF